MKGVIFQKNRNFDVKAIRKGMDLGIDSFASVMGVSRKLVEKWENGYPIKNDTAKNLLLVAKDKPELLKKIIFESVKKTIVTDKEPFIDNEIIESEVRPNAEGLLVRDMLLQVIDIDSDNVFTRYKKEMNTALTAYKKLALSQGRVSWKSNPVTGDFEGLIAGNTVPKGWEKHNNLIRPIDMSTVPKMPDIKIIEKAINALHTLDYKYTGKEKNITLPTSGHENIHISTDILNCVKFMWIGENIFLLVADPSEEIKKIKKEYNGKVEVTNFKLNTTNLKRITLEEYTRIFNDYQAKKTPKSKGFSL